MRISTLDAISMHDFTDLESAGYVIQAYAYAYAYNVLMIYFDNDGYKADYLDAPLHTSAHPLSASYALSADSEITARRIDGFNLHRSN